jgi:hypothetical protein
MDQMADPENGEPRGSKAFLFCFGLALLGNATFGVCSGQIWFPMNRHSHWPSTFYASQQPLGFWSAVGFCTTLGLVGLYFSFKRGRRYGDAPTDSVVTWIGLPLVFIFWFLCAVAKTTGVSPH